MNKFKNKYRIQSIRASFWNYRWAGAYFITICTKNRLCHFGQVINNMMVLSDIGKIVESEWLKTPKIRPDMKLKLGAHMVMPNHFHGIIIIGRNPYNKVIIEDEIISNIHPTSDGCRDAMHCVSTSIGDDASINDDTSINDVSPIYDDTSINDDTPIVDDSINETNPKLLYPYNTFGPQIKNLPSIIRGFKSAVTIQARTIDQGFAWQPGYYDHIIGDQATFKRISLYIKENPRHWNSDVFNIYD